MKIDNLKELHIELEKFLKTGRFSFAVLMWEQKDKAVINELIVKYDEKDHKPILYIKNADGEIVPIITESDRVMKEFLENFIEVNVDRTKNYEPSLYFMLRKDNNGNTGWNQSTIDQFYRFIEQNFSKLKPYVLQTFKDGVRDVVIPYVGTQMVFYDMGKLIKDAGVENFDNIVSMLYNLITDIRDNLVDIMNGIETKFNDMNTKLIQENERQNIEIDALEKHMDQTDIKLDEVMNSLGDIRGTTERRLLPVTISVGGNANMIYPVCVSLSGGGLPIMGGTEQFAGAMFLTMESSKRNICVQLGNDHMTDSPNYYTGTVDQYYVYSHKVMDGSDAKHYVYDVINIGSGSYGLLLRGATTYTLWTRYPANTKIVNNLGNIGTPTGDLTPIQDTNKTINPQLTDDAILGADTVRTFCNSVHVVNSIMIGNKLKMSIGG